MLDAVKENRVYGVDHGSLRNMADYTFTQYMAKVLYPEAFKDIDPVGNLNNYYKTYLPELKYDGTFMIHLNQKCAQKISSSDSIETGSAKGFCQRCSSV